MNEDWNINKDYDDYNEIISDNLYENSGKVSDNSVVNAANQ